jgi:regulator of replication initiation timing
MENIEVASSEHAGGISQVNAAITDMDKLTQENSLMVEHNASASQKMALETERLRRLFSSRQLKQENVSFEKYDPQIEMTKGRIKFDNFK